MADHLARVGEVVCERLRDGALECVMLGLPLGFPQVQREGNAMSNLGFWSRGWFETFTLASEEARRSEAARFFPWWNRAMDARFWLNLALALAWTEVPWHVPADEAEQDLFRLVLGCIEKAQGLDPSIPVPGREIAELRELLESSDYGRAPGPEGIGFRRYPMRRALTGGWTLKLPGYYYDALEDHDTTQTYWWNGRSVRGSSLSFKRAPDSPPPNLSELLGKDASSGPALTFSEGGQVGRATFERRSNDEDGEYCVLHGRMATTTQLCHVTICYDDEADAPWAEDCWRSIRIPPDTA
jgi:hypothetical protein